MIVRAFYNRQSFPDVLYVVLHERDVASIEKQENVTKLLDKDNEIVGYNIELKDFKTDKDGYQPMTFDLLRTINKELNRVFQEELIHDFKDYIVVGEVKECKEHPDSDHLHVCQVDIGDDTLQIVCGAHNVAQGQKVVVCLENAVLPNGQLIKNGKLRGVNSSGMLASEYELGLIEEKKKGILVLKDDYQIGKPFFERVK
jgi:tRNA-binding protein